MCGRYVSPDQAAIERHWHVGRTRGNPFDRRFNVAPTTRVPILLRDHSSGALELAPAIWGLIPPWWKEAKPPRFTFNARCEEGATKPMWRGPLKSARCLVPAEGWYEWRLVEAIDAKTGEIKQRKQPYYIHASSGRVFAFAGIMSRHQSGKDVPETLTCAILTAAAAPSVLAVHDRMPVVLSSDTQEGWLDPRLDTATSAIDYANAHAETGFAFHPVSARVNIARTDDEELTAPVVAT